MLKTSAIERAAGFTLLELVVALAIAALVTASMPVAWAQAFPRQTLRADAQAAAAALRIERDRAFASGRQVVVRVSGEAVQRVAPTDGAVWQPSRGGAMHWVPATGASELLVFYPDGSASAGALTLTRGARVTTVRVLETTGRIEVAVP
jgi:general secretion pathway protein H